MIEDVLRRLLGRKTLPAPPAQDHPLDPLELARAEVELADLRKELDVIAPPTSKGGN